MHGIGVMGFLRAPSFVHAFAFLLFWIPMCARTFCIVVLYWIHYMKCTMEAMRGLSRWLCRDDGL